MVPRAANVRSNDRYGHERLVRVASSHDISLSLDVMQTNRNGTPVSIHRHVVGQRMSLLHAIFFRLSTLWTSDAAACIVEVV